MTIRKIVEKNLLRELAGLAMEYEEPCDRISDIKKHCSRGRYIHADPIDAKTGLNCRDFCTRDRRDNAWLTIPDQISWDFCISHLNVLDFYGIDDDGNVLSNFGQKGLQEWAIVYDLSDSKNCGDDTLDTLDTLAVDLMSVDAMSVIDQKFPIGTTSKKFRVQMENTFGRTRGWGVQDVLISRPENYILVVQSLGY